jgi:hypothetical protein
MRVYELGADYEHYRQIDFPTYRAFWRWRQRFNGNPLRRYWTGKEKFKFFQLDSPKGDMPGLTGSIPVFTPRAVEALADFLEPNGELVKIRCQKDTLFLYNVTRIVDALDEDSSGLKRFDDVRMLTIDHYSFLEDKLSRLTIFKLVLWRLGPPYVTDVFVRRVEEAGLRGFKFQLVWSTEDESQAVSAGPFIMSN